MNRYYHIIPLILLECYLLILPVEVRVNYHRSDKEDQLDIKIKFYL